MEKKAVEMRTQLEEPLICWWQGNTTLASPAPLMPCAGEHILQEGPYPYNQSNCYCYITYGDKVEVKEVGDHLCRAILPHGDIEGCYF